MAVKAPKTGKAPKAPTPAPKKAKTIKNTDAAPAQCPPPAQPADIRTDCSLDAVRQAIIDNLYFLLGRTTEIATPEDWYNAVSITVRDRMLKAWTDGLERLQASRDVRAVAYLSAEFLVGPQLGANLMAMDLMETANKALADLGQSLETIIDKEVEPGLGNGGLGRLAACYMDSMASLGVPAIGYGIHYEFGMFRQRIRDGWQVEQSDKWLRNGFPWELFHSEISFEVGHGGHTETWTDNKGRQRVRWIPKSVVRGVAHDLPVIGHGGKECNLLRLWSAEAVESFDFAAFNTGNYFKAVQEKIASETISKVLYPNDDRYEGKQLRLAQQFFFVSCSLQDMIRMHTMLGKPLETLHETFAIQLNDTHPSVGVAELMRLLMDSHHMGWDQAWAVTSHCFNYTNHTLLPEALEKWPVPLFSELLPRHMEIVLEINRRFLLKVRESYPGDEELVSRVSLIDESGPKYVRMAYLATVGSQAVNGVAALHTDLLKRDVMADFDALMPGKFINVTNGVTPRRWLALCNPALARLITGRIGSAWQFRFEEEIVRLEEFAEDADFRDQWQAVKKGNKQRLAKGVSAHAGIHLDPEAMFDVQVKRIHEYKRQHLNILRVIALYNSLKRDPGQDFQPRAVIFGGKAAPGYFMAKLIIKLINSVAEVVNDDADVDGRIKVVFTPNFNVRSGQIIYPAADLSQQISLAGKEASGTGNMKFGINGAVTIGTLDGANVEMRQCVGPENFFLFGLTTEQVRYAKHNGYSPSAFALANPALQEVLDQIRSGVFSKGDQGLFRPLVDDLLGRDEYMVLADFGDYLACQDRAAKAYQDRDAWTRMSILNVARLGMFSSDRSIREYCEKIWRIPIGDGLSISME